MAKYGHMPQGKHYANIRPISEIYEALKYQMCMMNISVRIFVYKAA